PARARLGDEAVLPGTSRLGCHRLAAPDSPAPSSLRSAASPVKPGLHIQVPNLYRMMKQRRIESFPLPFIRPHPAPGGLTMTVEAAPDTATLRQLFLLDPDVAFLNHGSYGACPLPVLERQWAWQREMERRPVEFLGRRIRELMAEARVGLAREVNAD